MNLTNCLLRDLIAEYRDLRSQIYFKSSLTALGRAIQDLVMANEGISLVVANFQQEKLFRQQERRFQKMASKGDLVYILGVPDTESGFAIANSGYETIPLHATDTLAGEKYLVVIGQQYSACLIVREKLSLADDLKNKTLAEEKRFEGIWTFDRNITYTAADWLLGRIANYRPELKPKIEQTRKLFVSKRKQNRRLLLTSQSIDLNIFTQSLVTYLQAGQYKLLKAYSAIATAERKESLVNKIAAVQRSYLDPQEILKTTVRELGTLFPNCRCLLYRLNPDDTEITIEYESVPSSMKSLVGQKWSIADNPLFIAAQAQKSTLAIENVFNNPYLKENPIVRDKIARGGISSWLMVSIRYQGKLLGMLELHYGGDNKFQWRAEDISLVEAVNTSTGAALTQASAYTNLVELNAQLAAVERIQSNLIAIVGHELRTPLSTILVCLESLATEPNMPLEIKNSMLDTALSDSERLRELIQDFITLSQLETGKAYRNIESITIDYALNLALRKIQTTSRIKELPDIKIALSDNLPFVLADAEGLLQVFVKLLDNACKFTPIDGKVVVNAKVKNISVNIGQTERILEIAIADTGRGIEADRLETIFDRFSQSENYLRRTVSGAGLGLVICRKILQGMGGDIWANSLGKNRGSEFYFTLPVGASEE